MSGYSFDKLYCIRDDCVQYNNTLEWNIPDKFLAYK